MREKCNELFPINKIHPNRCKFNPDFFINIPNRRPKGLDRNYKFNTDWLRAGDADITNWYLIELTFAMRYFVERNVPIDENVCLDLITEYPCTLPSLIDYLIHFEAQLSPTAKNRLRSLDYRNEDLYFQGSLAYLRMKLFDTDVRENSMLLKKAFQASRSRRYWETNYEMLLLRITDLVKETRSTFLLSALVEMVDKVNAHWTEALSYSLADIALDDLEFLLDNTERDEKLLGLVGFGLHDSGQLDRFKRIYKEKIENPDYRLHAELKILLEGFE